MIGLWMFTGIVVLVCICGGLVGIERQRQQTRHGSRHRFLGGGLGLTAFDFLMTASQGGGTFLIATGAIAFGSYRLIRGVLRSITATPARPARWCQPPPSHSHNSSPGAI